MWENQFPVLFKQISQSFFFFGGAGNFLQRFVLIVSQARTILSSPHGCTILNQPIFPLHARLFFFCTHEKKIKHYNLVSNQKKIPTIFLTSLFLSSLFCYASVYEKEKRNRICLGLFSRFFWEKKEKKRTHHNTIPKRIIEKYGLTPVYSRIMNNFMLPRTQTFIKKKSIFIINCIYWTIPNLWLC